jgi:hypothetical protein
MKKMLSDERLLELNPANDGITHINFYTRGATRLGRLGTNLADVAVQHPVHGRFRTAEGLWYYLKTGLQHEEFRSMDGFQSKAYGKELKTVWYDKFQEDFKVALEWKFENHPELKQLLTESTLPLEHYYYYAAKRQFTDAELSGLSPAQVIRKKYQIVEPKDVRWLTEFFIDLRERYQQAA